MATDQADRVEALTAIVGRGDVLVGAAISDDVTHDEALGLEPVTPWAVVRPHDTDQVSAIISWAGANGIPVTARGSGTGLSGACLPHPDGIVISFERMRSVVEMDLENHVAVVQPGLTLEELDDQTAPHGLIYPVFPGESSASLGGNVATNAGGMRAVRYGVTRSQVLGLTAVLGTGEVIRTGGKFVKATSGYDLTQLIIGSEGTLAVVTEVTLRLHPRPTSGATILVPFPDLEHVAASVPRIVGSGLNPTMLEYIDFVTMSAITANVGLDLGVPAEIAQAAMAYLVVVLENRSDGRVEEDTAELAELVTTLGALDVFVLPSAAGAALIDAREKAFWTAKAHNANEIIDVVVPRAEIPAYLDRCQQIAAEHGSLVVGCGHAGDGNVHLSIFQPDPEKCHLTLRQILVAGIEHGGAISGEHGIGRAKKEHLASVEDPTKLDLMRRIKSAFDPAGILNPGAIFD